MPQKHIKAIDALEEAQKIAFAPFIFQTSVSLKKLGVLDYIFKKNKTMINAITKIKALEASSLAYVSTW